MKELNFKKSLLAVAAIAMSHTASARSNTYIAGGDFNNLSTTFEVNEDDTETTEPIVLMKEQRGRWYRFCSPSRHRLGEAIRQGCY